VQTVPLLAPFVTDGFAGVDAQAALAAIVGRDLGAKPKPWLAWYKTVNNPRHQNQKISEVERQVHPAPALVS